MLGLLRRAGARAPLRPWRRWMGRATPAAERLTAVTTDGVELAIHRVRTGDGGGPAVMLLHGLGANRFAFHFPERSLAGYLAGRGFDCFVPELRGAGMSRAPHWRYDVYDYLQLDVPAILSRISAATGQDRVHWVGHSMGGLILMAHGIASDAPCLASGLAIGSALDYGVGGSAFRPMLSLRPVLERLPVVPWGAFTHALSPLMGRIDNPIERFNFWPGQTEPEISRAVHANAFGRIPTSLLSSMASTFASGGLRSRDGALRYLDGAARFPVPLRLLAGTRDVQCPVATVEATARAFGPRAEVVVFEDFGHFDLLLARRAPLEVWPRIAQWLALHSSSRPV